MDNASIKKEAQTILSSLIVSCAKGLTVGRLRRDYKEETGQDIPFRKLGFDSFETFLHSIPETCQINGYGDHAVVIPVINEKNKHINDMILKQRPPKSTSRYRPIRRSRGIDNSHVTYQRPLDYKLPPDFTINLDSQKVLPAPHDYFLETQQRHHSRQPIMPRLQNQTYNHVKPVIPPAQPNYTNHRSQQQQQLPDSFNQFYDKYHYTAPGFNSSNQTYQKNPIDSPSDRHTQNQSYGSNHYGPIDSPADRHTQNQSYGSNHYGPIDSPSDRHTQNQSYGLNHYGPIDSASGRHTQNQLRDSNHYGPIDSPSGRHTQNQLRDSNHYGPIDSPSGRHTQNQLRDSNHYGPIDSPSGRHTQNQLRDSNHYGPIDSQSDQHTQNQSLIDSQSQSYNNSRPQTITSNFVSQFDKNQASQCVNRFEPSKAGCDTKTSDPRLNEISSKLHYYDESDPEELLDSDHDFSDAEDVYRSDEEGAVCRELKNLTVDDSTKEYYKEIDNQQSRESEDIYELGVKRADHKSRVHEKVRHRLRALISEYPDGIWCSKLLKMYHSRYKSRLELQDYGFTSVIELCDDMPDIFHCVRLNRTDWKLYDRRHPKPGVCGTQQFSNYLRTLNQSPDPNNTEPPIPEDFKSTTPYLYPDTVVKLGDSIPKEWLVNDEQPGEFLEVVVAEVYDPSKFWIQLKGSETSDALNTLMDDMQLFYVNNFETYKLNDINAIVGLYCAALFMNEYHRAVIARNYDDGTMKVFYIDYGTVGEVELAKTCLLHKSFSILPQQAIRSRLANIRPKEPNTMWPRAAAKHMLDLVMEKNLIGFIHSINEEDKILHLIITDTTSPDVDVHINDSLIENDFAVVGNEVRMCSTSRATVPNVHLYPTFVEIECNIYPSISDLIKMLKLGQSYETIFDGYFNHASSSCSMHSPDIFNLSHCSNNFDKSVSSFLSSNDLCITSVGEDESNAQAVENFVDKVNLLEENIEDIEIDNGNGEIACETVVAAIPNNLEGLNKSSGVINENPGFWNTDNLKFAKSDNYKNNHLNPGIKSPPPGFENVKPLINNPDFFGCAPLVPGLQQYYNPIFHPAVTQFPIPPANYIPDLAYYNYMNNQIMRNQCITAQQQQNIIEQMIAEIQFKQYNRYLPRPGTHYSSKRF